MIRTLSLLDAGIDAVDIYESAAAVKELGVGINVLPHAVRELTSMAPSPGMAAEAVATAKTADTPHGIRHTDGHDDPTRCERTDGDGDRRRSDP